MNLLWVDDDYYAISGLMRHVQASGAKIDVATSYSEAVKLIKVNSYDKYVIDLIIPYSDDKNLSAKQESEKYLGLLLVQEIRASNSQSDVFVLSAATNDDDSAGMMLKEMGVKLIAKGGLLPSDLKSILLDK